MKKNLLVKCLMAVALSLSLSLVGCKTTYSTSFDKAKYQNSVRVLTSWQSEYEVYNIDCNFYGFVAKSYEQIHWNYGSENHALGGLNIYYSVDMNSPKVLECSQFINNYIQDFSSSKNYEDLKTAFLYFLKNKEYKYRIDTENYHYVTAQQDKETHKGYPWYSQNLYIDLK